jgi:hypothetical protein
MHSVVGDWHCKRGNAVLSMSCTVEFASLICIPLLDSDPVWDGFWVASIRFKLQRFPNGSIPEPRRTSTIYVEDVFLPSMHNRRCAWIPENTVC